MKLEDVRSHLAHFGRTGLLALQALWAYKIRSLFVIVSVSLGIASLTVIIAAHDGANQKAEELTESFGPDAVLVLGGDIFNRPVGQRTLTLSWSDLKNIRQSLPGTYLVIPLRSVAGKTLRYKNKNWNVARIIGSSANYSEAWNWPLISGRDFTEQDVTRALKVCLIGETVAKALFTKGESPISKTIFVGSIPFTVIGELSYRGYSGGGGSSLDDRIIIPLTTMAQRFGVNRQYFRGLRIKYIDAENMRANVENLTSYLRKLHNLAPSDPDDFTILTAEEVQQFLSIIKGGLTIFLGVTAVTAMLVGGFVLANLFYLSVSERTLEIGLKRAIGASKGAIIRQFLLEAILLTILGGLLGIALGLALAQALFIFNLIEIRLSLKMFVSALGAAMTVGLIFGLSPARQAADLDPIRALRGDG
ncbi:ABC transporter permease [Halodesulfovibrio sp.]|jgi:putative ABC transport system permease protein|uniref:ABC transporter permease n=1 Tax=Halodesulfovibrio sp. TaxID=1912772 RepID=UPI0025D27F9C|nr:ABC transporter permease [Halodesulfovibrio sp.]MCT4626314.1 ABC transporter permease [Halodesulfovibrio sp.]